MNKRTVRLQKMEKRRRKNWKKEQVRRLIRKGLKQACRVLAKDTKALTEISKAYIKGGKDGVDKGDKKLAKDTDGVREGKGIIHSDR